jgi:dephospho-CoA kinase
MVLGITGGIATGKSTVTTFFAELGAAVVSADTLAREAVLPGSSALAALAACFGETILAEDGSLDRDALATIVFDDADRRAELNRITHPEIARLADERLQHLREAGAALIVYEAPLLFEANARGRVDKVLVVTASVEVQIARLMARSGLRRSDAIARVEAQMPLAEKIRRADFVIDNSGSVEQTRNAVSVLYRQLSVE